MYGVFLALNVEGSTDCHLHLLTQLLLVIDQHLHILAQRDQRINQVRANTTSSRSRMIY